MIYGARIRKRVRYLRIYSIKKRIGRRENIITRLFMKALERKAQQGA